ncbi:MAG: C25 family cysteine peptidase [bacterium]
MERYKRRGQHKNHTLWRRLICYVSFAVFIVCLHFPEILRAAGKIYWTDGGTGKVHRANLDGTGVEDVATGIVGKAGVALDVAARKMYWTDRAAGKIKRANLDGSGVEDLVGGLSAPYTIALNVAGGKVYWSNDNNPDKIERANLDGTGFEQVIGGTGFPKGIALDVAGGKLYWADASGFGNISRSNLDGTGSENVVGFEGNVAGIALDVAEGKMYWVNNGTGSIRRDNLDGGGALDVLFGLDSPYGIALDIARGKMYWTDDFNDKIYRANLDGTGVEDVVTGLDDPGGIALYFYNEPNNKLVSRPTAVNLISFSARGQNDLILLEWKTAQELSNFGFNIYKAVSREGPFIKLNHKLITGLNSSVKGKLYHYEDSDIAMDTPCYYRLEDIDIWGIRTQHGPVCIDWDGDNLPGDWEIMNGLDSDTDDAGLHSDRLSMNPDTAGKGIASSSFLKEGFATQALHNRSCARMTPVSTFSFNAAYKILLRDEGMYRLTRDAFEEYGIEVEEMDLSKARLFNLGREVAISVYDEDGDNRLDSSDYIQFLGQPLSEKFKKHDKNNLYWLTMGAGIDAPKRMGTIASTPKYGRIPETFICKDHYEEDTYYQETMQGGDNEVRWLFSPFALGRGVDLPRAGDPVSFTFHIPHRAGKGSLTISLYGTCTVEHEVEILLNEAPLGTYIFSGTTSYQMQIQGVDLKEGTNILTIACKREIDSVGLDWFDVTYPRAFVANDDHLTFSHEAGYGYHIIGFSKNNIQAFDITTPSDVVRIANFTVRDTGEYAVDFEPHYIRYGKGKKRYCILTQEAMKKPLRISEKRGFGLKDTVVGVNYIIITPRKLGWDENGNIHPWLNDLLTLRKGQGLKPIVVDLADIYDEFSHGIHTPQAIKDFLLFVYNNKPEPSPHYVVLLGDSSYDYTNNWNLKEEEYAYVPTYLIATPYKGESASDEWFVRTDDNEPIPDLCIGRLPAANIEQAEVMVKKILSYETIPNTKSWEKNVLLVADNITEAYETGFEDMNDGAASLIPPGMNVPFKGYLNDYHTPGDCAVDIKTKINEGCLIVNYNGHGWGQIWAKECIFSNEDIASLTNKEKLPFFVSMTCMGGYFINPESLGFACMAEALLRAEGKGAIAALMSTAMSTPQEQQILNGALFYSIFSEDIRTLGSAIARAKQIFLAKGEDSERLTETFLLFGDPAMNLKIPLPRKPTGIISQDHHGCITISWQETKDCYGKIVAGYNCYRSTKSFGKINRINSSLITDTYYKDHPIKKDIIYYYVLTSIDADGYESVPSQHVTAKPTVLKADRMLNTTSGQLGNAIDSNKYKHIASISASSAEPLNSEHGNRRDITDSRRGCFIFTVYSFSCPN